MKPVRGYTVRSFVQALRWLQSLAHRLGRPRYHPERHYLRRIRHEGRSDG